MKYTKYLGLTKNIFSLLKQKIIEIEEHLNLCRDTSSH